MVPEDPELRTFTQLIDGDPVVHDGSWLPVEDPYTGRTWGRIPRATAADVDRAVGAARQAMAGPWADVSGFDRARLLHRLADVIDVHADELGHLETADNGKLLTETTGQARFAARVYRYFAGCADKILGQVIPLEDPDLFDYLTHEPYGVCALLVSWNSPMQLLANKLAPALAAGNTVVIKPSEHASASVCRFGELLAEVGFPAGVVNIVTGDGPGAGATLVGHRDVDLISLTGGPETGRAVARAAAETMAKVVLELGGRSPQLVFADADLDLAVEGVMRGIFAASGQTCIAGSRLYVERPIAEAFLGKLAAGTAGLRLGDPRDEGTDMGPLANRPQYERVVGYLDAARDAGVDVLTGGSVADVEGPGLFVQPTVYTAPAPQLPIAREEIFGPVLAAWPFDDEDAVIADANDSELGLAAGVWTRDLSRAHRVARRLRAGTVWVNTYRRSSPAAPFGGMRGSGIGRERGVEGLREYLQTRNVMIEGVLRG